jgi:hypothetical protein
MVMDNSISLSRSLANNAVPAPQPNKTKEGEAPGETHKLDVVQMSPMIGKLADNLKNGETIIVSVNQNDSTIKISKEGPDRFQRNWENIKIASADVGRGVFRGARGVVEQDPSFAFREAIEVSKNSVERLLPAELGAAYAKGLYPVMRIGLSAIDVHKAIKTTAAYKEAKAQEAEQHKAGNLAFKAPVNMADKLIDYMHIGTDVAGLLSIATTATRLNIPGAAYFAAAAVIGDVIAGGWHAMRFATQGAAMIRAKGEEDKPQGTPAGTEPPAPVQQKPEVKEA